MEEGLERWLSSKKLDVLAENQGPVPSTHTATKEGLQKTAVPEDLKLFVSPRALQAHDAHRAQTHTQVKHSHT